jgi:hypothetical protein
MRGFSSIEHPRAYAMAAVATTVVDSHRRRRGVTLVDIDRDFVDEPSSAPADALIDERGALGTRLAGSLPEWIAECRDEGLVPSDVADDEVAEVVLAFFRLAGEVADGAPTRRHRPGTDPSIVASSLLNKAAAKLFPDVNSSNGALAHLVNDTYRPAVMYVLSQLASGDEAAETWTVEASRRAFEVAVEKRRTK